MNNAEYANFMTRFLGLILAGGSGDENDDDILSRAAGSNPLGITAEQLADFDTDNALLVDLVNQSRISDETAQMPDVN